MLLEAFGLRTMSCLGITLPPLIVFVLILPVFERGQRARQFLLQSSHISLFSPTIISLFVRTSISLFCEVTKNHQIFNTILGLLSHLQIWRRLPNLSRSTRYTEKEDVFPGKVLEYTLR